VRIEACAQDHDLGCTVSDRPLQRFIDEARPHHHHPDDVDDLDLLHGLVVAETQRANGWVIEGER